jgi:hypothetical protein
MAQRFAAADARYDAITKAAHVFSRAESRLEQTRSAVFLARWHDHLECCKAEAVERWFAGGLSAEGVLFAFDNALAHGVTFAPFPCELVCLPREGG